MKKFKNIKQKDVEQVILVIGIIIMVAVLLTGIVISVINDSNQ